MPVIVLQPRAKVGLSEIWELATEPGAELNTPSASITN